MPDPAILSIVVLALLLAGTAKGIVGFGIQVVALAILTLALDLLTAMAITLAPAIASNLWQALAGRATAELMSRLWPFLLAVALAVFVGALLLKRVDMAWLTALLGLVLLAYAGLGLGDFRFAVARTGENWLGPLFGAANGLIMGMTGSSVVPGTFYLQAIDLDRDRLVQAMGMLYIVSALALLLAMRSQDLLSLELGVYGILAIPPALTGMLIGQRIRTRLPEPLFRRIFLAALLLLGAWLTTSIA